MPEAKPKKNADLPVRIASAIVMLVIAGGALWLGGVYLQTFILVIAIAVFGEFVRLVARATSVLVYQVIGGVAGAIYIGIAAWELATLLEASIIIVGTVIFVDVFAYFSGRTIGGPKIAPRISPSKTWAGLIGGAVGASLYLTALFQGLPVFQCWQFRQLPEAPQFGFDGPCSFDIVTISQVLAVGAVAAIIAQSGDFFESWLKRKAGMKDSSNLIPGHGGIFDRTDGIIALAFIVGLDGLISEYLI